MARRFHVREHDHAVEASNITNAPGDAGGIRVCGGRGPWPKTIVSEQLRVREAKPRKSGVLICSKLVAEIKSAETGPTTFLS